MKFSDISLEEKEHESLELIHSFSKNVITDIDNKIKEKKPKQIEAPYIDLMVESYFSIQSFCVLMKEGLISSAAAILRVVLEQVSIVALISRSETAKNTFEEIKIEKEKYYSSHDEQKRIIEEELLNNKQIKKHKIKQYFDYGWYKEAGCKQMNIKSICETANTSSIYEMVDAFLNEFAHGQRSIYQFYRRQNGVDKWFISTLYQDLFQLFFILAGSLVKEYGENVFSPENKASFNMIEALYFDTRSRITENRLIDALKKDDLSSFDVNIFLEIIYKTTLLLDEAKDVREKYLLSQTYIRLVKQVITIFVYNKQRSKGSFCFDSINIKKIFDYYQPDLSGYHYNLIIPLDKLIEMLDIVDDDWGLGDNEIDYAFTYSINHLLEAIRQAND